jgi:hypothetical protein
MANWTRDEHLTFDIAFALKEGNHPRLPKGAERGEERAMEVKEELLELAYKQLDQAAKLLKAAGEELLAKEAEALADSTRERAA